MIPSANNFPNQSLKFWKFILFNFCNHWRSLNKHQLPITKIDEGVKWIKNWNSLPFAWLLQVDDGLQLALPPICGGFFPTLGKPNIRFKSSNYWYAQYQLLWNTITKYRLQFTSGQQNSLLYFGEFFGRNTVYLFWISKSFFEICDESFMFSLLFCQAFGFLLLVSKWLRCLLQFVF